jgi:hypothetical protein
MDIEKFIIENDIPVFCLTATSFPDGIMDAHQKLHALLAPSDKRRSFGISRPENGVIVYKASVEELEDGEAEKFHCERFIIKKGMYTSIFIADYSKDISQIEKAFTLLLAQPYIDPNGYCLEGYIAGKDVRCMVPLQS